MSEIDTRKEQNEYQIFLDACNCCSSDLHEITFRTRLQLLKKAIFNIPKEFGFYIGGYNSECFELRITREHGKTTLNVFHGINYGYISNRDKLCCRKDITTNEFRKFIKKLFFIYLIPFWKEKYYEDWRDGTNWGMYIMFYDDIRFNIHGSNGFPIIWSRFLAFINKTVSFSGVKFY